MNRDHYHSGHHIGVVELVSISYIVRGYVRI